MKANVSLRQVKTGRLFVSGLLIAQLLSGCSSSIQETLFTAPGKYDFYQCDQLAQAAQSHRIREQELEQLMDRATRGPAGGLVSNVAYRNEYAQARANQKLIAEAAAKKNCRSESLWSSERALR